MENPNVNKELSLNLELCLSGWSEEFGNNEEINDALDGLSMQLPVSEADGNNSRTETRPLTRRHQEVLVGEKHCPWGFRLFGKSWKAKL